MSTGAECYHIQAIAFDYATSCQQNRRQRSPGGGRHLRYQLRRN
jgi:hypothetical protein